MRPYVWISSEMEQISQMKCVAKNPTWKFWFIRT